MLFRSDEETASGLMDLRYASGERDKAFLVKYIKSLLLAREEEKAQVVAKVLFDILPDEEKWLPNYQFIFENRYLTGLTSDNFTFLVQHEKDFIRSYGKEVTAALFQQIYSGVLLPALHGRGPSVDGIDQLKKELVGYNLTLQKEIMAYLNVTKAFLEKDATKLLACCENEYRYLSERVIQSFSVMLVNHLRANIKENEKARLKAFAYSIVDKMGHDALKDAIISIANKL